jgi:DNA-binding response OmpR family regulator
MLAALERHGGRYVLVVDDEPIIREMVKRYLEYHGFEVAEAADAKEARQKIHARPPDAVLLDKNLPDGSGVELIADVRAARANCAVFVWTGYPAAEAQVRAEELGATGFFIKPIDMAELLAAFRAALGV